MACSSTKAEYRALASTTAELTWIMYILHDLGLYIPQPPTLFCDNVSALHMTINPVFHVRTKHIEIDYYFVPKNVALGSLVTQFVPSIHQVAGVLTKPLARLRFNQMLPKLGLWSAPRASLRGDIKQRPPSSVHSAAHHKIGSTPHAIAHLNEGENHGEDKVQ